MKKPRDTQWRKFYQAKQVLNAYNKEISTIPEIRAYLNNIFESAWFKKNFPHKTKFDLRDGRRRSHASGGHYGDNGVQLSLPKKSRREATILQMLAYGLTPREYAWHGAEFCCIYLRLVERYLGKEAHQKLQFSFRDHGVKCIWFSSPIVKLEKMLGIKPSKQELF